LRRNHKTAVRKKKGGRQALPPGPGHHTAVRQAVAGIWPVLDPKAPSKPTCPVLQANGATDLSWSRAMKSFLPGIFVFSWVTE
jgi:hypothetical protein